MHHDEATRSIHTGCFNRVTNQNACLSDINADSLRNMVEAACQGSQDVFNQNGEIILYVKEQDMELDQHFIFEPVTPSLFQEKIEPGILEDTMSSVNDSALIQLQESGLLSQEAIMLPVQDTMSEAETGLIPTHGTNMLSMQAPQPQPPVIEKQYVLPTFQKQALPVAKPPPVRVEVSNIPVKKAVEIKQELQCDEDDDNEKGPLKFDYEKLKKQKLTGPQGSKIFGCNVCSYRSATRTLLRQHMIIHADKKFQCKECKYRCHTASHLKRHMYTHSDRKPILCSQCGYSCTQNFQMKAHLIQHETDTPFVCKICNAVYKKEESLKVHMLGHDNVTKFHCTQCNYAGNRFGDFKRHVLTHSSEKPLKCTICSYTCIRQWRLKAHMKIHTQDKPLLRCDLCDFSCISTPRLKDHKALHTNEGVLHCESCDFVCTQPSRLKRHMKVHSNTPQKTYTGTTFPPAYQQKMELEQAEAEVSNQPTFISLPAAQALEMEGDWGAEQMDDDQFSAFAAFAGKQSGETYTITTTDGGQTYIIQTDSPEQFAQQLAQAQFEQVQQIEALPDPQPDFTEIQDIKPSPSKLKALMNQEEPHVKKPPINHSTSKMYHCELCDFSCDYKSTFSAHQKKHSTVKKYKCAHCEYMCNDTSRMKDHLLCHTTEKMFQCDLCDFSCKRRMGLKDHMKVHTGEKPYQCKECDYTCRSSEGLKSHMAKHYGVKPFTCDVCGQGCSSSYLLKKHKFIHGDKPLQCNYCDYKCIQKKQLTNHLLQHKYQHPFCCSLCSATYKKEESLKIHMMSHQNIRKFACSMCTYAGNRAADFRRHMLTHSSSKPLQCPHCTYSCIRQSRLKAHMMVHSEERISNRKVGISMPKAYRCAFCDFSCTRTSRLKSHLSKVHLDLPDNVIFSIDLKQLNTTPEVHEQHDPHEQHHVHELHHQHDPQEL
ncbi:hypothetical protein Btru_018737 [Bulinus truncatus]|nr:hypothetical protein Btru_018737 [Bulinus truncatus]